MSGQRVGFRGTAVERFWRKVAKSDACWNWTASTYSSGYGQFMAVKGKLTGAHRISYELANGPIPDGQSVLHRCDNRLCVRPDHLFLGSARDNLLDAIQKDRFYPKSSTHCPNGHKYTNGSRRCSVCLDAKTKRSIAIQSQKRRLRDRAA